MTKTVAATQARADFAQLIDDAYLENDHFIIQRDGVQMAVILGIGEYERLVSGKNQEREDRFRRLLQIAARNQNLAPEQVDADVQEAVTAVRNSP